MNTQSLFSKAKLRMKNFIPHFWFILAQGITSCPLVTSDLYHPSGRTLYRHVKLWVLSFHESCAYEIKRKASATSRACNGNYARNDEYVREIDFTCPRQNNEIEHVAPRGICNPLDALRSIVGRNDIGPVYFTSSTPIVPWRAAC